MRLRLSTLSMSCALISFLFCAKSQLRGQATFGNIIGTVTDPAGAVITGAKVIITSEDKGTVYNTAGNESGNFSQTHLIPGSYTVEFEAPGFQRFIQKGVVVGVDRSTRVDAQLTVGQITEQVSVSGMAPTLVERSTPTTTPFWM